MRFRLLILFFIGCSGHGFATLNLELTQGVSGGVPIVIENMQQDGAGNIGTHISEIIRHDLRHSGRFHLLANPAGKQSKPEVIVSGDVRLFFTILLLYLIPSVPIDEAEILLKFNI